MSPSPDLQPPSPSAGAAFYDDETVFATYITSRRRADNPNDTLEQPVIFELLGDITGARLLDLGCGAAAMGKTLLQHGAGTYLGIDGSAKMVAAARETLRATSGQVVQADLTSWSYPEAAFDVAVSSLALHYVADLAGLLARVHHSLSDSGRLVFSIEHPVITSSDRGWTSGKRQAWLVDDYFQTGIRETSWLGGRVVKYHRTIEDYFALMHQTGFVVDSLRESHPQPELFAERSEYERRLRIPLFLLLAGHKR